MSQLPTSPETIDGNAKSVEWNHLAQINSRIRSSGPLHSRPTTSMRKSRSSVGVTNRSKSVPLGSLDDDEGTSIPLPMHAFAPVGVTKNRRMSTRIDNVKKSHDEDSVVHHSSYTSQISLAASLKQNIREKILKRSLNVKPVVRAITNPDGYIVSSDLRQALRGMNLDLTEDEMNYCCPADKNINASKFLKRMEIPTYDHGIYDPLGDSRRREISLLSQAQFLRARNKQMSQMDTSTAVGESAPRDELTPNSDHVARDTMKWTKVELKKVSEISKKLDTAGVPLFRVVKKINKDGSGNVSRNELEGILKKAFNFGMIKDQIKDLWEQADRQDSKFINFKDLHDAVKAVESRSLSQNRDLLNDGQSLDGTNSGMSMQSQWADARTRRSPCLPSCHFNVRTRKSTVPRSTSEIIVPPEDAFAFCPDWMRSSTVTLANSWIMDGTGQGSIVKNRHEANLERRRAAERRMLEGAQRREAVAERQDESRLNGIARIRHDWLASMQGIWA